MISLTRKQFDTGDGKGWRGIKDYAVWYRSPFGLSRTLDEALMACNAHQIDAEMAISMVPVVMAEDGTYEAVV